VSAANVLAVGLASPVHGRLMDTLGQTRVLVACAIANPVLLGALVLLVLADSPLAAMIACAGLAGALLPALSPAMRVLWPSIAGEERTNTAFALETVTLELAFVGGPLLAAGVSLAVSPAAAVLLPGAMTLLGAGGFAASAPSRAWRPRRSAPRGLRGPLASPAVRTVVLASLPVGVALGAVDIALPAFADGRGSAELGGLLLAAFAAGSTFGGLWYGARTSSKPLGRRWLELNVMLMLGLVPLVLAWSVPAMAASCVVAGLAVGPIVSSAWALLGEVAPVGQTTEANTWYEAAWVGGTALGAAAAGVVVEAAGVGAALVAPCAALAVAAALAASWRRTLAPA
jgi:MFS family permease